MVPDFIFINNKIYFDFSTQNKMIPDSDNPKISHLSPSLMHFHLKSKEWVSLWKSYTLKKNITVCLLAYQNFRVVNIGRKKVRQEESLRAIRFPFAKWILFICGLAPGRKMVSHRLDFFHHPSRTGSPGTYVFGRLCLHLSLPPCLSLSILIREAAKKGLFLVARLQ